MSEDEHAPAARDEHGATGEPADAHADTHADADAGAHGDAHDDHAETPLGPIDWPAWRATFVGIAVAAVIVLLFALAAWA